MNGRIFALLLIAAVIIGVGAAVGLIAYMERDDADEGQTALAELPAAPAVDPSGGASAPSAPEVGASQPAIEELETLAGTVESLGESGFTIATAEGTETVVVGEDARLTLFLERSLENLEEGMNVTLMGQRDDQGEMRATVLLLGDTDAGAFGGVAGAFGAVGPGAGGGQISPEDIAALRAQLGALAGAGDGGQIPPEARQRLRVLATQQGGGGGGLGQGAGLARRGGISGKIAQVGEGRVTIDTDRGPVEAVPDHETLIREVTGEGELADLPVGAQVTVLGSWDGDAFRAAQVIMNPDFGETLGGLLAPGGPAPGGSTSP